MAQWKIADDLPYLDEFPVRMSEFTEYPNGLWKIVDGDGLPFKTVFPVRMEYFTDYPKELWLVGDCVWGTHNNLKLDYEFDFGGGQGFQLIYKNSEELPLRITNFSVEITAEGLGSTMPLTFRLLGSNDTLISSFKTIDAKNVTAPNPISTATTFSVNFDNPKPYKYHIIQITTSDWFDFGYLYQAIVSDIIYDYDSITVPYKKSFPEMPEEPKLPPKPLTAWRHVTGELPLRPWPMLETSTIRYDDEIVEKKTIDWGRSMQQTYEYYIVNPETWQNQERIDYIISTSITHDSTSRLCGSSNMNTTEALDENYIRTYLVCNQDGHIHKECLGTYLYMTTNDSFDGVVHEYNAIGYTSLVELDENCPMLGYFIPSKDYAGRDQHVSIANNIRTIVNQHTRCELETAIEYSDMLTNDIVPAPSDTWLDIILNMIKTVAVRQYVLGADEMGNITLKVHNDINKMIPTYDYTDDDTSLLLPTLNTGLDLYKIPNVVEVIFSDSKHFFKSRAVNNDEESPISIQKRKREIVKRVVVNNIGFSKPTQKIVDAYAEKLLESESTIRQEISYTHGYCGTKVGDCVTLTYRAAGLNKVKGIITAQTINCVPGCTVDETMVYIKKLWRSNAVTSEDIDNMAKEDEDEED